MFSLNSIDFDQFAVYLSPDNKHVAFKECKGSGYGGGYPFQYRLGILDMIAWTVNYVTTWEAQLNMDSRLFSSDGKRLVYAASISNDVPPTIYTNNIQGTDQQQVLLLTDFIETVGWIPNSQRITYFDGRSTFIVDTNGEGLKRVAAAGKPIVWSSDGKRFINMDPRVTLIYRIDQLDQLTPEGNLFVPSQYFSAVWSPDNQQVAFAIARSSPSPTTSPDGQRLFVENVAPRTNEKWIANGSVPSWSPDGSVLAFIHY